MTVPFTDEEVAYIRSQPLARVATTSSDGQPDVVPVGFEYDGTHFWIGGYHPSNTHRTRNVQTGSDKVALVIDDLAPGGGWKPRYLRVYGTVELVELRRRPGELVMKITPTISWSLNLDGQFSVGGAHGFSPRRTIHQQGAVA